MRNFLLACLTALPKISVKFAAAGSGNPDPKVNNVPGTITPQITLLWSA